VENVIEGETATSKGFRRPTVVLLVIGELQKRKPIPFAVPQVVASTFILSPSTVRTLYMTAHCDGFVRELYIATVLHARCLLTVVSQVPVFNFCEHFMSITSSIMSACSLRIQLFFDLFYLVVKQLCSGFTALLHVHHDITAPGS
jgi:hypothetical protein